MGRQKLGNKNAQANNNAKHNYNQEFSSEFKANQQNIIFSNMNATSA